jgi:uncharacterized protein YjiS (DUF1127 family)
MIRLILPAVAISRAVLAVLADGIAAAWRRTRRARAAAADRRELARLPDAALRDIGLTRSGIAWAVAEAGRRPGPAGRSVSRCRGARG